MSSSLLSYRKVFRLIFVIFSCYLMGDAFYRWDGFTFYASFSEFLPSAGLVTIAWSIVAAFVALVIWIMLRGYERLSRRMGWKIKAESILMFIAIFLLFLSIAIFIETMGTRKLLSRGPKLILLLSVFSIAMFWTWRYRNKADIVQDRITPLVWLFGIWFIVSLPLVFYHTWLKHMDNPLSERIFKPSPADANRPNIILVSFDALTARDMSAYGYSRPTTPFINEWSKSASLFTSVESASNWTTSSVASMMTGKSVWTHRMYHADSKLFKGDTESFPLMLKENGYFNAAFVANDYASVRRLGLSNVFDIAVGQTDLSNGHTFIGNCCGTLDRIFNRVFAGKIKGFNWAISADFILGELLRDIFLYPAAVSRTEVPPDLVFNKFFETADNGLPEPFFAWIHVLPPHDPYLPGEPYTGMFNSSPKLRVFNKQMKKETQAHTIKDKEDWGIYRARYDEFIRYCDKHFEDFIHELMKRDRLKDTVIILTADHGESFEHGYFTHNSTHHYEQVTHIPLLIREPHQAGEVVIKDTVAQIDIPPTILSLAKIPVPAWMEGRSLLPLMRGEKLPAKNVYSMSFPANPSTRGHIAKGTIAVWDGDYKLVYYLERQKSMLFNLRQDPDELNNLVNKEKEVGQHLLSLIRKNLEKANERIEKAEG
jgi:arylsulfatase A-like enzyme